MTLSSIYLPVRDLKAALAFSRDGLGFEEAWREGELTAGLTVPSPTERGRRATLVARRPRCVAGRSLGQGRAMSQLPPTPSPVASAGTKSLRQ